MGIVKAAAIEYPRGRVQVLSNAQGRARRFEILIGSWVVEGAARSQAIARRVEERLRRLGVKEECISVRVEYKGR